MIPVVRLWYFDSVDGENYLNNFALFDDDCDYSNDYDDYYGYDDVDAVVWKPKFRFDVLDPW